MFASYPHTVQPMTPVQFPEAFGHPAPMVAEGYPYETPYRAPSPSYGAYRPGVYTPPSLDVQPKLPSITVPSMPAMKSPPTVNLNLLTPPPQFVTTALTPQTLEPIPNTLPLQSVKKEMHMAVAGTDSALAGIDTPIARHVGKLLFPLPVLVYG